MSLEPKTPPNSSKSRNYPHTPVRSQPANRIIGASFSLNQIRSRPGLEPPTTTPSTEESILGSTKLLSNSSQTTALYSNQYNISKVSELSPLPYPEHSAPGKETHEPSSKKTSAQLINKARASLWLPRPAQPLPHPTEFQLQRPAIAESSHTLPIRSIKPTVDNKADTPLSLSLTSVLESGSHVIPSKIISSALAPIREKRVDNASKMKTKYHTNSELPPASYAINLDVFSTPSDDETRRLESTVFEWDEVMKKAPIKKPETPESEIRPDIAMIGIKWEQAQMTISALKQLLNKSKSMTAYYLLQNKLMRIETQEATRRHEVENKLAKVEVNKLKRKRPHLVSAASLSKSALSTTKIKSKLHSAHKLSKPKPSTRLNLLSSKVVPLDSSIPRSSSPSSLSTSSSSSSVSALSNPEFTLHKHHHSRSSEIAEKRLKNYQKKCHQLTQEVLERNQVIATLEKKLDTITAEAHQQHCITTHSPRIGTSIEDPGAVIDDEGMAALGLLACQEEVNKTRSTGPEKTGRQTNKKGKGKEKRNIPQFNNNVHKEKTGDSNPIQALLSPLTLSSNPSNSNSPQLFDINSMPKKPAPAPLMITKSTSLYPKIKAKLDSGYIQKEPKESLRQNSNHTTSNQDQKQGYKRARRNNE
ncbi:hypothetical protein NADFUDRAFT_79488 [Nadsonia fulvescens var. elongata DSM 6958]|uniref:Uncharacterized protein n=1 Tax=Nadsonia fulvescens var. elongata DSM 6958 TaxID=857566 RepID=A0A1E3PGU0_9ASCO|nr:hypothetical protein NADFUDRAFT_79488 [Nadsonia fulvescens var. elongata DSM 6958]